jgi:uncharacterized protein with von Willebrand factor type A (vWA) domain
VPVRYGFRSWGEGDDFEDLDADELLGLMADDLLESGDLDEALERLLREGFTTRDGRHFEGLRDLLERARQRRRDLESQANPSEELQRYYDRLAEIEETERAALDELRTDAATSGDERRQQVTDDLVNEKELALDLLPDPLHERINSLSSYEFVSSDARESFEEMMDELRRDVLNTYFEANKSFLENPDPEEMARLREMMDALSSMIEQDRRGEDLDPTFEDFMDRFGDYFPGAGSLEDVIRMMAERAAAAEAMFNSLSSDQQGQLRDLFSQMMGDMDLNFSLNRLVSNLRQATPDIDWNASPRMRGQGGSFADAAHVAEQLRELGQMEDFLGQSHAASGLPEVDVDAIRRNLGPDAAQQVEALQQALKSLRDSGFVNRNGQRMELSPKGIRQIGQQALRDLFSQLHGHADMGDHRRSSLDRGGDREETSSPWEPGKPLSLHLPRTVRNAIIRSGPGLPVRLHPDDFEVEEYESIRKSAVVFAIDLSLSMAMRGNLVPAKKMTLALTQLITSKFPRDFVAVVGFGELAREVRIEDVPLLTIDYNYGTNLQHALALSRHLMRHEQGERQIVVVTDGEPTAHLTASGEPFFAWPPVPETLQLTMAEVLRCTKAGIAINIFALDIEKSQFPFVEQISRVNGGRTFYTSVDDLGSYVLDDYVRHRRAS